MPRKVHLYTVGKTLTDCTVPPVSWSRGLVDSTGTRYISTGTRYISVVQLGSVPLPVPVPVPVHSACLQNQCPVSYPHIEPRWTRICPRILFTFRPQREPNQTLLSATESCRHTIQVKPVLRKSV